MHWKPYEGVLYDLDPDMMAIDYFKGLTINTSRNMFVIGATPPKTNMEPENDGF